MRKGLKRARHEYGMGDEDGPEFRFDESRQQLAKAHRREVTLLGSLGLVLFPLVLYLSMLTGISLRLEAWTMTLSENPWIGVALYLGVGYLILNLVALPLRIMGRLTQRRYQLTKQSWASWGMDLIKSMSLGLLLALLSVEALYWTIRNFELFWWLVTWVLALAFTVVAGYLAPVVILPLFYKVRRLDDAELRERLSELARRANVPVMGVYEFRSSPKTERGTAAVAGLGSTRRVLLSDHITRDYSADEVEGILAHELAHHVQGDSRISLLISAVSSLLALYLADLFVRSTMTLLGVSELAQVANLPLFVLFGSVYSMALGPLTRGISRWREAKADRLGASLCGRPRALASALVKLHDQNLSDASPPRPVEVLFYTHPAGKKRVTTLLALSAGQDG